jgi:hypothetical protein
VKNMTYSLLKKANLIYDIKEQELVPKNDNTDNFIEKR